MPTATNHPATTPAQRNAIRDTKSAHGRAVAALAEARARLRPGANLQEVEAAYHVARIAEDAADRACCAAKAAPWAIRA